MTALEKVEGRLGGAKAPGAKRRWGGGRKEAKTRGAQEDRSVGGASYKGKESKRGPARRVKRE